jgi:hypothetical protein
MIVFSFFYIPSVFTFSCASQCDWYSLYYELWTLMQFCSHLLPVPKILADKRLHRHSVGMCRRPWSRDLWHLISGNNCVYGWLDVQVRIRGEFLASVKKKIPTPFYGIKSETMLGIQDFGTHSGADGDSGCLHRCWRWRQQTHPKSR